MIRILILTMFLFGCVEEVERRSIFIPNFNTQEWIQDSLACNGVRENYIDLMSDTLTKRRFMGVKKEEVILTLGLPNFTYFHIKDSMYAYFMSKGQQCHCIDWRKRDLSEAEQIIFFISSEGKVESVLGVLSP